MPRPLVSASLGRLPVPESSADGRRRLTGLAPPPQRNKVLVRPAAKDNSFPPAPSPDPSSPAPCLEISIEEVEAQLRPRPKAQSPRYKPKPPSPAFTEQRRPTSPPSRSGQRAQAKLQRLAESSKAQELGLSHTAFKAKIKELLLLLPGLQQPQLMSLDLDSLKDLVTDTAGLANRLVQVASRFNASGCGCDGHSASDFLVGHLGQLTAGRWERLADTLPLRCFRAPAPAPAGGCHPGFVDSVAITPDGLHAVSGGLDAALRVWDLRTGACAATLRGHEGCVTSVAVSRDGRRAVSGSWDRTLRVWDLEAGACVSTLRGHANPVLAVALTLDGCSAVSGGWDRTVRVWDLESGACVWVMEGHTDVVRAVAVTPDGRRAVSGGDDTVLRVWDLQSGACLGSLKGSPSRVSAVAVAPDGCHVVSGGDDTRLWVWDLRPGACVASGAGQLALPPPQHLGPIWRDGSLLGSVSSVDITPDGRHAVSCTSGRLQVWDLQARTCTATLHNANSRWHMVAALSPDGREVALVEAKGQGTSIWLWDLQPLTHP